MIEERSEPTLRMATLADLDEIERLMKASIAALFPALCASPAVAERPRPAGSRPPARPAQQVLRLGQTRVYSFRWSWIAPLCEAQTARKHTIRRRLMSPHPAL